MNDKLYSIAPGAIRRRRGGFSYFLSAVLALLLGTVSNRAAAADIEKAELKFGFIKLTDMAPLAIAYEKGFFEDEGLYVTLEAQANWKVVSDRLADGSLDGAHALTSLALGSAAGFGTQADLVNVFAMGENTLAITVSNEVWSKMKAKVKEAGGKAVHPISAAALKPAADEFKAAGKKFNMAMTFPTSTHNLVERYWLAAGGIHPGYYTPSDSTGQTDADVLLSVTPPPQMVATLDSGTIFGFCVGEPWNQQAVIKGVGVPVITANEIWKELPEKTFTMRRDFVEKHPNTTRAIVKALIRAVMWIDADSGANRKEMAKILSRPEYVGADYDVLVGPLTGSYQYEKGDVRPAPDSNVYFRNHYSYPYYSDGVWYLTQMRRWGLIGEAKSDSWYDEIARKVYRPDIYRAAAEALVNEGKMKPEDLPQTDGYKPPTSAFIDGIEYDGRKPNTYLAKFVIGRQSGGGTPQVAQNPKIHDPDGAAGR